MSEIPDGAIVPQDHQTKKAAKKAAAKAEAQAAVAEAAGAPRTVEYDGVTYVVSAELADLELMDDIANMADGRWSLVGRIVRKLIGAEQYEQFKMKYRDPATGVVSNAPAIELFNKIDASLGE